VYLLDTNVISEMRKVPSGRADPNVIMWLEDKPLSELFISVITLMELEIGVRLLERRDSVQGRLIRTWLENHIRPAFDDRCLMIDQDVALICASYHIPDPRSERDAFIAATAHHNGLKIITRNQRDFDGMADHIINPWHVD